jgi:two-component system, LuxR family, response regulator FixJ
MSTEPTVFIVDDDPAFLESLSLLITSLGLKTKTFPSPEAYLQSFDPAAPGCLILDVRMPKMSGLAVQESLAKLPVCPAIIIMTGHAEVPTALRAMRQGAVDFLQKTFSEAELCEAIQRAIAQDAATRAAYGHQQSLSTRFALLSDAERQVLTMVLRGSANKTIASSLHISRRTVEDRRARMMEKLRVETLADLVRLAIEAGEHPDH